MLKREHMTGINPYIDRDHFSEFYSILFLGKNINSEKDFYINLPIWRVIHYC